jgi:UDP-N-acetylmuramyl tripeptide synthase
VAPMSNGLAFRDSLASTCVRVVNRLSRLTGRGSGTVAGGRIGLRLAPELLSSLARARTAILVSGTNGKTTTTSMVAAGWGGAVTTNATGANMPAGHVAALAADSAERVVLEVDEAWLPVVMSATRPRVVVLLNLSRDQLDRASEVRQIAERWRHALENGASNGPVIVANANDPLVVYAAEVAVNVVWCDVPTTWIADAVSCPKCTTALTHTAGRWYCQCGFAKPSTVATTLHEELVIDGQRVDLELSMPGEFNRSNAAMALSALARIGVDLVGAAARVNAVKSVAGRFSVHRWRGHTIQLLLAKNPAGFAAMLSTVPADDADVWVAINARIADGRDPSWLYDVPFEVLRGHRVLCLGERRHDLATRLDYARVDFLVVDDESKVPTSNRPVQLLANYTAFSDWLARLNR